MKLLALVLVAACSGTAPPPSSTPGSGSQTATPPVYSGPAERGPCTDVHGCKLRNNCGCSCDAVALSAPATVKCEESCPNTKICEGYSLICDMATQTCGAIPKSP